MRLYFSPQSVLDLEDIADFIALDNPRRALTRGGLRERVVRALALPG